MCGVCTVTILSSLMPPGKLSISIIKSPSLISGLATRHSAVFRHEEAPAWVSRAWTSLTFLAHGVTLATLMDIAMKAAAPSLINAFIFEYYRLWRRISLGVFQKSSAKL